MKATRSALLKWLAHSLVKCIPMGEAAADFATDVLPALSGDVYDWWRGDKSAEERREDLETLATAPPEAVKEDAQAAVAEAAKELDCEPSAELLSAVQQYLEQVPDAIRRSMRRPEDSRGLTVPPHLMPRSPAELAALLPQRPPKFKAGDRPIPGVDLELVSPLGAGGFGEVWRARKTHLGQDVALKFCLDPTASQSLRNETSLLRRLMTGDAMHPGIVRLLATYNDCTALEYEFVEGGDLAGVIRDWHGEGRRPAPRAVIDAIRQIADIVAFAHALEPPLVHRDLKPANILVNKNRDGSLRFRLTDFGIGGVAKDAKHLASGATLKSSTTSIHGSYSALYASPQQMRAEAPAPTDDVFSLGVIFWQLANGDLTDGVPGGAAWMKELEGEGYPADVVALIASCFDRRADRRPQTAGAFVEALKRTTPPPLPPVNRPEKVKQPVAPPPLDPTTRTPSAQAEERQQLKRALTSAAAAAPRDEARIATLVGQLEAMGTIDAETRQLIHSATTPPLRRPPVGPPPASNKRLWIILAAVLALMLLSCVAMIIIAAIADPEGFKSGFNGDDKTSQAPASPAVAPAAGAKSEADEALAAVKDWQKLAPADVTGDVYVNTVPTARGPASVVRNGNDYFLTQINGPRVRIFYNEVTGAWSYAN